MLDSEKMLRKLSAKDCRTSHVWVSTLELANVEAQKVEVEMYAVAWH
jgi:hypothetical protein